MGYDEYLAGRLGNMACHNLLQRQAMPAGTSNLLGLGLNYCLKSPSTTATTKLTFSRMASDVRRIYHLQNVDNGLDEANYIPKLYIKSEYTFPDAPANIEKALANFKSAVLQEQLARSRRKKPSRNLSFRKWNLIQHFKDHDDIIIIEGDKNLGPCILDRSHYIVRGCQEHLASTRNYRQLTSQQAMTHQRGLQIQFRDWLGKFRPRFEQESPVNYTTISDAEATFLRRAYKKFPDKLARFRMTAKVHKTPYKFRPVVCCVGTFMNAWSQWLDYWLQTLKPTVPTYVKDSQQVLDELSSIVLPPNAKLFTTDAHAMYANIDTDHAIEVISWWLHDQDSKGDLPTNFPLQAVLSAMKLIMKNNIFEWGDLYFLQLLGTAMGTSAACMWATLYYAYHEVHCLLPKHGRFLLYFKRFIDDIFGIWVGNETNNWTDFCTDVNTFGVLTWDITEQQLSSSVDFLDLTLTIEGTKITSRTYQKKMNLYLYIPPASAHPTGCIKGTIFGLIRRYKAQNTYRRDFVNLVKLLYRRLIARGWDPSFIRPIFSEACRSAERPLPDSTSSSPAKSSTKNRLFIHMVYHPDDIPRRRVQELYEKHCGPLLRDTLGIERPTIAYSRPKNIGDFITKAKLHQARDNTASSIMGEYRRGLSPS